METTDDYVRDIQAMTGGGAVPSLSQVDAMLERYPFFTLPAVALLRRNPPQLADEDKRRLIAKVALNLPDRTRLHALIDPDGSNGYDRFYPEEPAPEPVSTDDAIDTFLDTYGNIAPEEEELLTRMIFNPVPDYASMLAEEEKQSLPDESADAPADSQDALLNAFILKSRQEEPSSADEDAVPKTASEPVAPRDEPAEDALLSESLAKIYIKQHRYERAYEIISRLNLNYPEKSVYFADQLRFLRKLIINSQHSQQKK